MRTRYKFVIAFIISFGIFNYIIRKRSQPPPIFYPNWLPFGFNGFIIPPFGVFIRKEHKDSEELELHELVHWKQYQREGLFKFLLNYVIESNNRGYDGNKYEIEARY